MTSKEQAILRLTEVFNFLEKVDNGEWSDALSAAIKVLDGENPFEDTMNESFRCTGECDKTYALQEEYENAIHDAIDELEGVRGKTKAMDDKLKKIIQNLWSAI